MQDYSEKRDFYRMAVDCAARYRVDGAETVRRATVKDLSAGGVQLRTEHEVDSGAMLNVEMRPGRAMTPPLHAVVRVIRCMPADDGGFSVACTIERMLSVDEAGADFP